MGSLGTKFYSILEVWESIWKKLNFYGFVSVWSWKRGNQFDAIQMGGLGTSVIVFQPRSWNEVLRSIGVSNQFNTLSNRGLGTSFVVFKRRSKNEVLRSIRGLGTSFTIFKERLVIIYYYLKYWQYYFNHFFQISKMAL